MVSNRQCLAVAEIFNNLISAVTESSAERILPEDWDHFHILLEQMLHRVPSLGDAVLERLCNGPEAFSPDCKWIVGEAPEVSST
jgi:pyruvate dehydrogenase phosphatase regulatory subunit